jgi:hypothetical protein
MSSPRRYSHNQTRIQILNAETAEKSRAEGAETSAVWLGTGSRQHQLAEAVHEAGRQFSMPDQESHVDGAVE